MRWVGGGLYPDLVIVVDGALGSAIWVGADLTSLVKVSLSPGHQTRIAAVEAGNDQVVAVAALQTSRTPLPQPCGLSIRARRDWPVASATISG